MEVSAGILWQQLPRLGLGFLDFHNYLLAGRMCTRQGVVWRPTALLAQQASVINSESVCGRYVTVLASPFD